jgi:hypothetical protein
MVDLNHQNIENRSVGAGTGTNVSEVSCWLAFGGCIVILLLTYASLHERILEINYKIEETRKENTQLAETNDALRAEYSHLVNPKEVESVATRLGLISPNQEEVTILEGEPLRKGPTQVAESRRKPEILYE